MKLNVDDFNNNVEVEDFDNVSEYRNESEILIGIIKL